MRLLKKFQIITFLFFFISLLFLLIGYLQVTASDSEVIVNAKILEVDEVVEIDGLRTQTIRGEILQGELKGTVYEIQVPLESKLLRPLAVGDRIKVSVMDIGEEKAFQFYDFARSKTYVWILVLFIVLAGTFLGIRGIKTLIPSFILILLIFSGIVPDVLGTKNSVGISLVLVTFISAITAWFRLKSKLLTFIVSFSTFICLLISYLIFAGLSNTIYVLPFIGSLAAVDDELYTQVMNVLLVSIFYVSAGGLINASIQVSKSLVEEIKGNIGSSIGKILKQGLRLGQRISSGELNNLIMIIVGISLAGTLLIKGLFDNTGMWDHGWISLQVLYAICAGLSFVLITPITVFITSVSITLIQTRDRTGEQRKLRVTNRLF